ncbi:nucleotidyltransferase family protein [Lysobacter soyae]|uniref:Nucleotidyltransferase domain-containing protein n=1 Tax=Lysobacter soyae TaxID=2764185 RepID=A0ABX8WNI0_9GAMM|nr:nucleotidyltransferase domain-containing protein [Lysobacter sp. CJ11]QYR52964.1 nucleotidyltransferase domain-containing protein [Lysobacter sp. CJ11]
MNILDIQGMLKAWASANTRVARLWIFGSRAKGTSRPDSDIDIAIELNLGLNGRSSETSEFIFATWAFESNPWKEQLELLTKLPVDLQLYDGQETPTIQCGVNDGGLLVFDRSKV